MERPHAMDDAWVDMRLAKAMLKAHFSPVSHPAASAPAMICMNDALDPLLHHFDLPGSQR
eukprot:scaffold297214_cov41-Prasinocladus_malaysianus.AAC.1